MCIEPFSFFLYGATGIFSNVEWSFRPFEEHGVPVSGNSFPGCLKVSRHDNDDTESQIVSGLPVILALMSKDLLNTLKLMDFRPKLTEVVLFELLKTL